MASPSTGISQTGQNLRLNTQNYTQYMNDNSNINNYNGNTAYNYYNNIIPYPNSINTNNNTNNSNIYGNSAPNFHQQQPQQY
jgi:hypothetical protein